MRIVDWSSDVCSADLLRAAGVVGLASALCIALDNLFLHGSPDFAVQARETGSVADFGNLARPRQVDTEIADRMRHRTGRQDDDAIGHRNGPVQVMGDEQHRLATPRTGESRVGNRGGRTGRYRWKQDK